MKYFAPQVIRDKGYRQSSSTIESLITIPWASLNAVPDGHFLEQGQAAPVTEKSIAELTTMLAVHSLR